MAENTDPKLQRVEMSAEEYAAFQAFKAEKARQEAGDDSRLDYVYLTRGLYDRVTEVRVVVDRYTRPIYAGVSDIWRPSDHRPILVDFDF